MTSRYPEAGSLTLSAHLANRPNTLALHDGRVSSDLVKLDICGPASVVEGFKPLVREAAFEVSEIPLMTFLLANSYGKPLKLLPAVLLGRFQHDFIARRRDLGEIHPSELAGRRIGIRSYTVTTVVWARAILEHQFGLDLNSVTWVAHEDPHLEEFRDPPNVERVELGGRSLLDLLEAGEIDAAILPAPVQESATITRVAPQAATRAWFEKTGVVPINHLFAVNTDLALERPDAVREIYRMLEAAKMFAPATQLGVDVLPFGAKLNRRNLEFAIRYAWEQGLIAEMPRVDGLFPDSGP